MLRHNMTPTEARDVMKRLPAPAYKHVEEVESISVRTTTGLLRARLYRPRPDTTGTVLFLHGGGWVTGGLDSSDALCRGLAQEADCTLLSLDYRLAPEHPFPAALEDTWDVLNQLAGGQLPGIPAPGPIAVAGMSAGGNLAAVVALLAREQEGPSIAYQLLIVPVVDCDVDRPSYFENISGLGLEREEMRWFWRHYLADPGGRRTGAPPPSARKISADCRRFHRRSRVRSSSRRRGSICRALSTRQELMWCALAGRVHTTASSVMTALTRGHEPER